MDAWAPGACETAKSKAICIHVADELDEALEVDLLVIVERQVAAIRTGEVAPLSDCPRHPCHVFGIHRVVPGADDQGRHGDLCQVGSAVPVQQFTAGAKLARSLYRHIN